MCGAWAATFSFSDTLIVPVIIIIIIIIIIINVLSFLASQTVENSSHAKFFKSVQNLSSCRSIACSLTRGIPQVQLG